MSHPSGEVSDQASPLTYFWAGGDRRAGEAVRIFEVWVSGDEDARGLVRAPTMHVARLKFLAGVRAAVPGLGLRRVRARALTEDEARELYPGV